MKRPMFAAIALLYCVFCVFTYGYAWNHADHCERSDFTYKDCDDAQKTMIALTAATFAPLYWSVEMQEKMP